jgi:hypothetical protein
LAGWPSRGRGLGLRGVDRWHERVTEEDTLQGVQRIDAILAGGGDIAADAAEVDEGLEAAEGAGDLLTQRNCSGIQNSGVRSQKEYLESRR